ncbi:MAG: hypothetical protein IIB38_07735 [Candidatus Hydrogenedentes bacterium]|nr:hypothetical protein [Candidatus Hydrogenedentota bacterium]
MDSKQLEQYRYGGARAMVLLHERHMRSFVRTWRTAKSSGVILPETESPAYASMEALLAHLLRAAGGYMTWMCGKLDLPAPGIESAPEAAEAEQKAEDYLDHLLERWRLPLAEVAPARYTQPIHTTSGGVGYSIDAILEHAVMHPIRHEFQLANLIEKHGPS